MKTTLSSRRPLVGYSHSIFTVIPQNRSLQGGIVGGSVAEVVHSNRLSEIISIRERLPLLLHHIEQSETVLQSRTFTQHLFIEFTPVRLIQINCLWIDHKCELI